MSGTGVQTIGSVHRHGTRYVLAVNIEPGGRPALVETTLDFDEAARVWLRFFDPDIEIPFDVISDACCNKQNRQHKQK